MYFTDFWFFAPGAPNSTQKFLPYDIWLAILLFNLNFKLFYSNQFLSKRTFIIYDSRQLCRDTGILAKKKTLIMIWHYSISGYTFYLYLNIMKSLFTFKSPFSQRGFFFGQNWGAPNWRESYEKSSIFDGKAQAWTFLHLWPYFQVLFQKKKVFNC